MVKQVLRLEKKGTIYGMVINVNDAQLIVSCYDDGYVYSYDIEQPITASSKFELSESFKGPAKPLQMAYWEQRKEVYVGHKNGMVVCYKLGGIETGPVCK